ncbi:MAG: hypothetical protein QME77_03470 [bacterium]|nr:hypothetical protein [bacterium]
MPTTFPTIAMVALLLLIIMVAPLVPAPAVLLVLAVPRTLSERALGETVCARIRHRAGSGSA